MRENENHIHLYFNLITLFAKNIIKGRQHKAWSKRRWCSLQYITKTVTYSLKSVCSQLKLTFLWKTSLEDFFFNLAQNFRVSSTYSFVSVTLLCYYKGSWKMRLRNALCFLLRIFTVTHITSFVSLKYIKSYSFNSWLHREENLVTVLDDWSDTHF